MKSRYYFALTAALVALPLVFTACNESTSSSDDDELSSCSEPESSSAVDPFDDLSSSSEKSSSSKTKNPMDERAVWCVVNKDSVVVGQNVVWSLMGGGGDETWTISGDYEDVRSTETLKIVSFTSTGKKTAYVTHEKNGATEKITCPSVVVVEAPDSVDVEKLNILGTCGPVENEVAVNDTVSWKFLPNVLTTGYKATDFVTASYEWHLDSAASQLNSTRSFISTSYGTAGEHKASLVVTMKDGLVDTLSCAPVNIVESAPAP